VDQRKSDTVPMSSFLFTASVSDCMRYEIEDRCKDTLYDIYLFSILGSKIILV
jgi:hypothetical protein